MIPANVVIRYSFDKKFKDIFLDLWYDKNPESYYDAYEACDRVGNDMLIWLSDSNIELYRNLYEETLRELQHA